MDMLTEVSSKLKIPTNEFSSEIIQIVLIQAKRSLNSGERREEWNDIAEVLWNHLQTGLSKYDDQLLCATCFFSVLTLTDNPDVYLNRILLLINSELNLKGKNEQGNTKNVSKISEVVSIMYGLFQSPFLIQKPRGDPQCMGNILKSSFSLLLELAYEYSRFTFLAFKTINSFKKVIGNSLQEEIFNTNGQILLLNLVNQNWENPITGVRDLNRGIFRMVISVIDQEMYEVIFKEIHNFYWNKAKYLMLSEIIEQCNFNIQEMMKKNDWVEGLTYSLHKPGLVSAGADMYYAVLKKLNSDNEWCDLFLKPVIEILTSESSKAIENFTNYWCLTTLKKYPSLTKTLMDELDLAESTENKIFSSLSILKQANKLGLSQKDWTSESVFPKSLVLCGIDSCNPSIRIQAFDVICVSQRKTTPHKVEFDAVLNYLQNNVNSDCTVLRLSMLTSLNRFLMRLHTNFMTSKGCSDVVEITSFCMALQKFIVASINLNGNYQRKITTVKLCKLIQDYFNNPPIKMQNKGSRGRAITLAQMLKENKSWILDEKSFLAKLLSLLNDPSDDIRENVTQLLLTHYSKEFQCPQLLNQLIHDALKNIRSKFFYDINCGRSMFKLITNILLTEESFSAEFKNVEDVFLFAYNELKPQYKAKTDILKSIENGKQLHSLITILHVVLEVCYQNSYKIGCLEENFFELVTILEGISNQFAWEDTSTSSDFSKMSDMVQNMIATSGYETCDEIDQTKISGLHQIVLNCLWLNVKVSCDLASFLVQFTENMEVIDRCLKINTRVLETCRHKGAIEAAGAAIGRAIQYLTSLPEGSPIQQLPYALLKSKLKDLISEAGAMASVTRRGAGLSIMVHRIVSGDMKRGKPLFHYFMETLLETCNKVDDIPETNDESTIDNQKDLPKAIYIHFLTRIVTDSSLASDMMYYSAKLAALAFGNLTSPRWQIRNAALQLYGALVPKLIGQKKASGEDDETVATVACDEFRSHSPALWKHITNSLAASSNTSDVETHSNLVPILNILANIARRYNFSFDIESERTRDGNLLNNLISLLDSPLYTIRRLSAKCIFNIFSIEVIYTIVLKQDIKSENYLHGALMLLAIYCKKQNVNNLGKLKAKFADILNTGNHSYICRQLYEELFPENLLEFNINKTLMESRNNTHSPGVSLWAERNVEKYVINMQWQTVPQILQTLLDHNCELYGAFLVRKIKSSDDIAKEVLLEISKQLLDFNRKYDSTVIWEILYEISLRARLENIEVKEIIKHIKENDVPYKLRYAIPFAARVSTKLEDLNLLSEIILQLSDPETTDSDMRYIAALANNEMALDFEKLPDAIKINAITSAMILLQDEDEDIRTLNVQFYKNIIGGHLMNPYICLQKILNTEFLYSVLQSPLESLENFCDKLSKMIMIKSSDVDVYNPFANDSKNIYIEVEIIRKLIEKLR